MKPREDFLPAVRSPFVIAGAITSPSTAFNDPPEAIVETADAETCKDPPSPARDDATLPSPASSSFPSACLKTSSLVKSLASASHDADRVVPPAASSSSRGPKSSHNLVLPTLSTPALPPPTPSAPILVARPRLLLPFRRLNFILKRPVSPGLRRIPLLLLFAVFDWSPSRSGSGVKSRCGWSGGSAAAVARRRMPSREAEGVGVVVDPPPPPGGASRGGGEGEVRRVRGWTQQKTEEDIFGSLDENLASN